MKVARLKWMLAALLCVLVAACSLWALWSLWTRSAFEGQLAVARSTLLGEAAPSPADNAVLALGHAATWLADRGPHPSPLDEVRYGGALAKGEQLTRVTRYLEGIEPYFALLREVTKRPEWHIDRSDLYAPAMVAPIEWLIEASRVLEDSVKFDSTEDGITSRAANATTLILALAAKCEPDYFLDYRVQQGVRRRVLLVLRHVQSRPGFRAVEFRSTVEPVVAALCRDAGPPRRVLECERAQCVLVVDTVTQGTAPAEVVTPKGARQRWWGRPLLYRDALCSCDLVDRTLTACPTTAEMAVQVAAGLSGREPPWLLNGDVLHDFFLDYADTAAALRLMRVAMALLAYRESHRRLPDALDQLAGYFADGIPIDPYSGAAFGYSPGEGRVWSVRPGMDDERKQVRGLVWLLDSSE